MPKSFPSRHFTDILVLVKSILSNWSSFPVQGLTAVNAKENPFVTLSCGCLGYPIPNIFWQQSSVTKSEWSNTKEIVETNLAGSYERNSTLFIPAIHRSPLNQYRCTCTNIHGNNTSSSIRLLLPCII